MDSPDVELLIERDPQGYITRMAYKAYNEANDRKNILEGLSLMSSVVDVTPAEPAPLKLVVDGDVTTHKGNNKR